MTTGINNNHGQTRSILMRFLPCMLFITLLTSPHRFCRASSESVDQKAEPRRFSPEEVAKILRLIDSKKLAKKKKLKRSKHFKRYLMMLILGLSLEIMIEAWWHPSELMRNRIWPDKVPPTPATATNLNATNAEIQALKEQLAAFIATQEKLPAEQQRLYEQLLEAKIAERLTPQLEKMRDFETALSALRSDFTREKESTKKGFAAMDERVNKAEAKAETACKFAQDAMAQVKTLETEIDFKKVIWAQTEDQKKKSLSEHASETSSSSSSSSSSESSTSSAIEQNE